MSRRSAPLEVAEVKAQQIGRQIKSALPNGWGFLLCLTEYGEGGNMTYVSSCHRSTIPSFCRELADKLETGEGSLDVKSQDDPVLSKALELLDVVFGVLTCPGVEVSVDATQLEGAPSKESAERLAADMQGDFRLALERAGREARELLDRYKKPEG